MSLKVERSSLSDLPESMGQLYINGSKIDKIETHLNNPSRPIPTNRHGITATDAKKLAQVVHEHFNAEGDTHYIRPGENFLSPRHVHVDKEKRQAVIFSKKNGRPLDGGSH